MDDSMWTVRGRTVQRCRDTRDLISVEVTLRQANPAHAHVRLPVGGLVVVRTRGEQEELGQQQDAILEEALEAVDEVARLRERLEQLQTAAEAVVSEGRRMSFPLLSLETALRNAYAESDEDPDTVVPVEPRPFQVGDRVTFTDEDGSVWPGCTVRAPMALSFHAGKFRIDNGDPEIASLSRNGFTFSTYAHPSQMVLEVPNG